VTDWRDPGMTYLHEQPPAPAPRHPVLGLYFLRDRDGLVHLADESLFGGLVAVCDEFGDAVSGTVVEAVPDRELCAACLNYWTPREDPNP
jgi:hypothetical protein